MTGVFDFIVSRAVPATWLILIVLFLRLCLKRSPKWLTLILWGLVAVRLMLPVSLPSVFSLVPQTDEIVENVQTTVAAVPNNVGVIGGADGPTQILISKQVLTAFGGGRQDAAPTNPTKPTAKPIRFSPKEILSYLWLAGAAVLLLYGLIAYLRLAKTVSASVQKFRNLYACDDVETPFILGIFRPRIYIPSGMAREDVTYVAMHERAHIRSLDHVWKVLGYLLLSAYWFHPLVWVSYVLLCKDMELACDERVIKLLDKERRADYSQTLLSCALPAKKRLVCPLAFGEVGVKERVKNVLSYKKPAFWVILLVLILAAVVAVCFLTDPLPKGDFLKSVKTTDLDVSSQAQYKVSIGKEVKSILLQGELWQNGHCEYGFPFVVKANITDLQISMNEKRENGRISAVSIQALTNIDTKSESVISFASFDLPESVIGRAYTCENAKKIEVFPNQSQILCVMVFDMGNGVRAYDCKTLTNEPERLESADCTLVVRATFYEDENPPIPEDRMGYTKPTLSINDLVMIAQEGKALTWSDFDGFRYDEVGSGLYIRHFPINADFALQIGGPSMDKEPMYVRLIRADDPNTYLDLPGDIFGFVEGNKSESRYPFENVMGMSGYYVDRTEAGSFVTRTYYGNMNGIDAVIGESFGYSIYDTVFDLDGDGVTELICNCEYGADGHEEVYVYRRKDGRVERGCPNLEQMYMPDWNNWGVNSYATRYDADKKQFIVSYDTEDGQKEVVTGLPEFRFEAYPPVGQTSYYLTLPCDGVESVVVSDHAMGYVISLGDLGDLKKGERMVLDGAFLVDFRMEDAILCGMDKSGTVLFLYGTATEATGTDLEASDGAKIPLQSMDNALYNVHRVRITDGSSGETVEINDESYVQEIVSQLASVKCLEQVEPPKRLSGYLFSLTLYDIKLEETGKYVVSGDSIVKNEEMFRTESTDALSAVLSRAFRMDFKQTDAYGLSQTYERDQVVFALRPTEAIDIDGYGYFAPADQEGLVRLMKAAKEKAVSGEYDMTKIVHPVYLVYGDEWYSAFGDGTLRTHGSGKDNKNVIPADAAKELLNLLYKVEAQFEVGAIPPEKIVNVVKAEIKLNGEIYTLTDKDKLKIIERQFRSAELFGGMSKCPFTALITFTTQSGNEMTFGLATDSCGAFLSDGFCYEYSTKGNEELFGMFGITPEILWGKLTKP